MISVFAPAYYPSLDYVRYLRKSAEHNFIPVRWYGVGRPYSDWFQVQITDLIAQLQRCDRDTVLYTDASDAILLSDTDEIEEKYDRLGSPDILISVEHDGQVCAGGWMGNRHHALEALRTLRDMEMATRNPQLRWRQALDEGLLADRHIQVIKDDGGVIFEVTGKRLEVVSGRVYNPVTGNRPCLLHFAGGYTAPGLTGKAELIEPTWKELGYD